LFELNATVQKNGIRSYPYTLKLFENRVLGQVFWPKTEEQEPGGNCITRSLWVLLLNKYNWGNQIDEDVMGGARGTYATKINA